MTDRDAILRRRNRFIAMALVGGSAALAACDAGATPCLSDVGRPSDVPDASPVPCLSPPIDAPVEPDAGSPDDAATPEDAGSPETDAGSPETDAGSPETAEDAGAPVPCLSLPPPSEKR